MVLRPPTVFVDLWTDLRAIAVIARKRTQCSHCLCNAKNLTWVSFDVLLACYELRWQLKDEVWLSGDIRSKFYCCIRCLCRKTRRRLCAQTPIPDQGTGKMTPTGGSEPGKVTTATYHAVQFVRMAFRGVPVTNAYACSRLVIISICRCREPCRCCNLALDFCMYE